MLDDCIPVVIFTDFGRIQPLAKDLPFFCSTPISAKTGEYDRRYRMANGLNAWVRAQKKRAETAWIAGEALVVEPLSNYVADAC